jgi:hypothetical protein
VLAAAVAAELDVVAGGEALVALGETGQRPLRGLAHTHPARLLRERPHERRRALVQRNQRAPDRRHVVRAGVLEQRPH